MSHALSPLSPPLHACSCLAPDTPVPRAFGPAVPAARLRPGDAVLAADGPARVLASARRLYAGELVTLHFAGGSLTAPAGRPVGVLVGPPEAQAVRWLPAGRLSRGDRLAGPRPRAVERVERRRVKDFPVAEVETDAGDLVAGGVAVLAGGCRAGCRPCRAKARQAA